MLALPAERIRWNALIGTPPHLFRPRSVEEEAAAASEQSSSEVSSAKSVASIISCNPTGWTGRGLGVADVRIGVVAALDDEAVRAVVVAESGGVDVVVSGIREFAALGIGTDVDSASMLVSTSRSCAIVDDVLRPEVGVGVECREVRARLGLGSMLSF